MQALRRHRFPVTGSQLADELGISLRTLYRDIASLRAQGAPVDGEAGVGYVLQPGYLLPPLMFQDDEIEALALGAAWVAERGGGSLGFAARNAMAKIASVLPDDVRARLDVPTMLVGPGSGDVDADDILSRLRTAIRAGKKVRIAYGDAEDNPTVRVIWPFVLGFFERVRVVAAWCELRGGFRHFRLDRIGTLEVLPGGAPRRPQSLLAEWRKSEGITQGC